MQQAASSRLGFGVKKTMLAQRLYEAGYITYMRTDSTNLSQDAIDSVRSLIHSEFGDAYLPEQPIIYGSKRCKRHMKRFAPRMSPLNQHYYKIWNRTLVVYTNLFGASLLRVR